MACSLFFEERSVEDHWALAGDIFDEKSRGGVPAMPKTAEATGVKRGLGEVCLQLKQGDGPTPAIPHDRAPEPPLSRGFHLLIVSL